MVTLTFEFNKDELQKANLTENDILKDVREYAKKHTITETSFGVFEKDGKEALAVLMKIGVETLHKNSAYLNGIERLGIDNDGEKEDIRQGTLEWLAKGGTAQINVTLEQAMEIKNHGIPFNIKLGFGDTAILLIDKQYFYSVQDIIFNFNQNQSKIH